MTTRRAFLTGILATSSLVAVTKLAWVLPGVTAAVNPTIAELKRKNPGLSQVVIDFDSWAPPVLR